MTPNVFSLNFPFTYKYSVERGYYSSQFINFTMVSRKANEPNQIYKLCSHDSIIVKTGKLKAQAATIDNTKCDNARKEQLDSCINFLNNI